MLITYLFAGLFVAISAAANPPQRLSKDIGKMKKDGDETYYVRIDLTKLPSPHNVVNYKTLLLFANMCFNFLKVQNYITTSGSKIALVACVGIAESQTAYCASTPRKTRNGFFATLLSAPQDPHALAPRWEAAFRSFNTGSNWAHAEDFAYWLFEQRETPNFPANTAADRYPDGTTVAVWSSKSSGDRGDGGAYVPCDEPEKRSPTCQEVANKLGVTHALSSGWKSLYNPQGLNPINPYARRSISPPVNRPRDEIANVSAAPVLDMTPMSISPDMVKAIESILSNPPKYSDVSPVNVNPEDEFDSEQLDAGNATSTGPITGGPAPTPTPTPTCFLHNQDPDQGIHDQFCLCDGSKTYPTRSLDPTAPNSELCAYTALPNATTTISSGFGPPTTYSSACQICTQVVNNEDSCNPISGCILHVPSASVTVATEGVHVGTLTGDALYTSVSSALESICPDVTQTTSSTQCSGTATIQNIIDIENNEDAEPGELQISAPLSSYNVTSLKTAMIKSLAATARSSAAGNNCYDATYSAVVEGRAWPPTFSLFARDGGFHESLHTVNVCNTAKLALVNYYSEWAHEARNTGPSDWIEVEYAFHKTGGSFGCAFLEALVGELVIIEPEFAVADVQLEEAIAAVCEGL